MCPSLATNARSVSALVVLLGVAIVALVASPPPLTSGAAPRHTADDGGWVSLPSPGATLYGVALARTPADGVIGWAVGAGGTILKYVEGTTGPVWVSVISPTTATLRAVSVTGDDRALAVGDGSAFFEYSGGAWRPAAGPPAASGFTGVALTGDGMFVSTGGEVGSYPTQRAFGDLWQRIGNGEWQLMGRLDHESFRDMDASADGKVVVAVGGSSTPGHEGWVSYTRRNGVWEDHGGFGLGSRPMESVGVLTEPDETVWMAGAAKFIHDGYEQHSVPEGLYYGIAPLSRNDGWLGDLNGHMIRFRDDAFEVYTPLAEPRGIEDIAMLGPNFGFAVGDDGLILSKGPDASTPTPSATAIEPQETPATPTPTATEMPTTPVPTCDCKLYLPDLRSSSHPGL